MELTSVLGPKLGTSLRMALSSGAVRMTYVKSSAFATSGASHSRSWSVTMRCVGFWGIFGFKMRSFSSRHLGEGLLDDGVVLLSGLLVLVADQQGVHRRT